MAEYIKKYEVILTSSYIKTIMENCIKIFVHTNNEILDADWFVVLSQLNLILSSETKHS